MNARQAANVDRWALEDAAAAGHSCLMCGGRVPAFEQDGELVVWELCRPCNEAFAAAAARVLEAMTPAAPAAGPVQVPGQLELAGPCEDQSAAHCEDCQQRWGI